MLAGVLSLHALATLNRDGRLLFAARMARMFGYGVVSVLLVLYLAEMGYGEAQIGLLLTLILAGDALVSLAITTRADRLGRRRMLLLGALLMGGAGLVFGLTTEWWLLVLAGTIGVISPSGNEVGPFLTVEQSCLAETLPAAERTGAFAWYHLAGASATATGALVSGSTVDLLRHAGWDALDAYRVPVLAYAAVGAVLLVLFSLLSPRVEVPAERAGSAVRFLGLHRSKGFVLRLSALFALDAFAGGFIVQSIVAWWFHVRFGVSASTLGAIFFGANLLAAVSALTAAALARRIGLLETMVFTHLPSNVLLVFVPLMPTLPLAILLLLVRYSISQMDVPTRQSYTMAVVAPDERSAASGVTGVARTVGAAASPSLAGLLLSVPGLLSVPFFVAGGLKIVYDLLVYRGFRRWRPPEEVLRDRPA